MSDKVNDAMIADIDTQIKRYVSSTFNNFNKTTRLPLEEQRQKIKYLIEKCIETYSFMYDFDKDDIEYLNNYFAPTIEDYLFCSTIKDPTCYKAVDWKPWLTQIKIENTKWEYSQRYERYLLVDKGWNVNSIDSINKCTNEILGHCGDPTQKEPFEIKGLVIGDVQSGKTANYTSLINKAIDVGYKIIIVMTGTTNDLRSQTQKRLDKEVKGFKSDLNVDNDNLGDYSGYGVAKYGEKISKEVSLLTDASENGDLKRRAGSFDVTESGPVFLAVIKKNISSLKQVIELFKKSSAYRASQDKKMPFPVLMIDDEADLASINTRKASDLQESTSTNRLIRTILFKTCRKFSYVGYTATPFANVFIDSRHELKGEEDSDDIFPKDFIICLPTPPNYSGVGDYFGINEDSFTDDSNVKTDLLTVVEDDDIELFNKFAESDVDANSNFVPESLRKAIKCFLISSGIKVSRGFTDNFTMLINVNVRVKFNSTLRDNVKHVFERMCVEFKNNPDKRLEFKEYWENEMLPVSKERNPKYNDCWDGENGIESGILQIIKWKTSDSVKLIVSKKGAQGDDLDYSQNKHNVFVCVGGQKLSRGLTLEGLSVSYYGRNAGAIDSLMQMGRWFGYRKGWIDLCRVFTSKKIASDFVEAAIVTENLKDQIEKLSKLENATPNTFGLYVKQANNLLPTSRSKLRHASEEKIGFSASLGQTIEFNLDDNQSNLSLVEKFINNPIVSNNRVIKENDNNLIFKHIDAKKVLELLGSSKFPSSTVNNWIGYIKKCNKVGELIDWTVVVSSNISGNKTPSTRILKLGDFEIVKPTRSLRIFGLEGSTAKIRAITNPSDYVSAFNKGEEPVSGKYNFANDENLNKFYTPDKGIIVIYVFDLLKKQKQEPVEAGKSIVGYGIWFPKSNHFFDTYVYANCVEQERLRGQANAVKGDNEDVK